MDVNQTSAIASVYPDAKKSPQHRDQDDQGADKDDHPPNQSGSWREVDAVDVDASLLTGMSTEAQGMIDSLNRCIEPLRTELELAKHREAHFCDLAAQHSILDIPCRREFVRELSHVLTHISHQAPPPSMIMLHVTGTEDVRMKVGRRGLDQILRDVSDVLTNSLQPTDVLGSLGGSDFGIILLSGDEQSAGTAQANLRSEIRGHTFTWGGQLFDLDVLSGASRLIAGESSDAVLDAADREIQT